MTINTAQFQALLRPGLTKVFSGGTQMWGDIFKPRFPEDWLKQYEAEFEKLRRERWLAKHKPSVQARISRLNPTPWPEGGRIRGWHPNIKEDFTLDVVRLQDYLRRWGDDAPYEVYHQKGRQKFVTRRAFVNGPA